ncbi:hypothetical protein LCGC14_0697930 [marine sediment metagenome]|uniref:Uncharacterized protein n=1 Tax=marine sediment metagenome TaxID=412755 RepID=A0A0F9QNH0_9ZZZZ|nr:hypothetical protein [bacterium]
MSTKNYIKIYRDKLDYHKYEREINKYINKLVHEFTVAYKGITNYRIREVFWDLIDEKIEYHPRIWYHVFANLMGKLAAYEILFVEKKINKFHKNIHNEWVGYLANLLIPYEPMIPTKFFNELIQNMPVPDFESVLELYEEGIILFNENLKEIMLDPVVSPYKKILKFKANFSNLFEIFMSKCLFLDQELSNHGETAHINSLHEVFQLNNSNERTPSNLLREMLILLNHIRNAISHGSRAGIVYIKKKGVRIRDFKANGKLTFERYFSFEELYDFYYLLLILIMEFELMALMLSLHRVIRELNINYNKRFICSKCGYESVVFVHPERTNVVCNKCKTRHHI